MLKYLLVISSWSPTSCGNTDNELDDDDDEVDEDDDDDDDEINNDDAHGSLIRQPVIRNRCTTLSALKNSV